MVSSRKTFNPVVEHVRNVEGVKQEFYLKTWIRGCGFSGSFAKGSISHGYSRPLV